MPTPRKIDGHRYWTPRILTANTVFTAGGIVLWFFVSTWVLDIKTAIIKDHDSIDNLTALMAERHTASAIWRQSTTDRIDFIDNRLAKVETQVYKQ